MIKSGTSNPTYAMATSPRKRSGSAMFQLLFRMGHSSQVREEKTAPFAGWNTLRSSQISSQRSGLQNIMRGNYQEPRCANGGRCHACFSRPACAGLCGARTGEDDASVAYGVAAARYTLAMPRRRGARLLTVKRLQTDPRKPH